MPMNDAHDVQSHDQLLHYQLGARLGEGGFGQVFQAWDTKLHRHVAIKYLKNFTAGVDLTREARLAASLQHAAFVKIHALEQTEDSQAIVMELVPGRTLRQILDLEAPGIATVLDMVRQVAQAMQEAHAAGLIHGDLKPSNLMQEPSGAVRILDFGLATQADRDATTSLVQADPQGTIAYMAPEILTGAKLQASADIYALGVILYELLTARRPFSHLSGLALAAALIQSDSDQWPWPDHLPLSLRELVRAATARALDKRIASMEEFAQRCTQLLELDPVSLHSASLNLAMLKLDPRFQPVQTTPTAWLRYFQPTRKKLVVLAVLFSLWGLWYSQPYWSNWSKLGESLKTYSEAQEMKQGLAALAAVDRGDQLDLAQVHFAKVLDHTPSNAAALAGVSLLHSFRYQLDESDTQALEVAADYARQSLNLNDFLALSHMAHAKVLDLRGQQAQALTDIERALSLDMENTMAWRIKIDILMHARRIEDARNTVEQAMSRYPQEGVFAMQAGQLSELQSNFAEAERAYTKSLQVQKESVSAYRVYASFLARQNRVEEAVKVLQLGLSLRPNAVLFTQLGELQLSRGDYVGAAAAFEGAVAKETGNTQDFLAWARLANALSWIPGRNDSVQQAYTQARDLLTPRLEQAPTNADYLSRMAGYKAKLKDFVAAQQDIKKALSIAPEHAEILFRAAVVYEMAGQREAALGAINKARQLGYSNKAIDAEPELLELRRDPTYMKFVLR